MLQSHKNYIESAANKIVKHGGPSSSEDLRSYQENVVNDLLEMHRLADDLDYYVKSAYQYAKISTDAIGSMINTIDAQFGPTGTVSGAVADFYTNKYVLAANTDATINNTYGQATLRVNSTQEKLCFVDSAGITHIPENLAIYYSYGAGADDSEYVLDPDAKYAVDGRSYSFWGRKRGSTGDVWIRVVIPGNLNQNKLINSICLSPMPLFGLHLYQLSYRQPNGTWTNIDLAYQNRYNATTTYVYNCSNMRFIFPAVQATEIRIRMDTPDANGYWGFKHIKAQHIEFASTSTLKVEFGSHGPGVINRTVLKGKDESSLDGIARTVNGAQVALTLPQQVANTSPVITGVESYWG